MHASRHHAAHAGYQLRLARHRDNARRRAHHVHHIAFADIRAHRIPVRVECAHWNRNPRTQSQFRRPLRRKTPGFAIARLVCAAHLRAHALQERVHLHQKLLRRQPAPLRIPHPLVTHRAYTALQPSHALHAAQRRRHHVAVFERRHKPASLFGIMPQPVQQFRKSPLMRIHSAAPLNRFQTRRMRLRRNLLGFGMRAMITPQVVVIEGLKPFAHRHHARPCRIQRNCCYRVAIHARRPQHLLRRRRQRRHLVRVRLRRKVRVLSPPVQGIRGRRRSNRPPFAVY